MVRTEYAWMTSRELVDFVMNAKDPMPLVVELAQRLDLYMNELQKELPCPPPKAESRKR